MATKTTSWSTKIISPFILPRDGIWFESRKPFPPPVKGVYQLVVTLDEVILRSWEPCLESLKLTNDFKPRELLVPLSEFQKSVKMQNDISGVFGQDVVQHIIGLGSGHIDYLARLPVKILHILIARLHIGDILHLSEVNKSLNKVCHSNVVWKKVFQHAFSGIANTPDVITLSKTAGWYKLYVATDRLSSSGESLNLKDLQELVLNRVMNVEENSSGNSYIETDLECSKIFNIPLCHR